MVKRFADSPTLAMRGVQIWHVLVSNAMNRQTLTYGMLAEHLGFKGAGTLARMLGHVFYYCDEENLPPLTVLVVGHDSGIPGEGFEMLTQDLDRDAARERVYAYDWYGVVPPTQEALTAAFGRGHPAYLARLQEAQDQSRRESIHASP